MSSRAWFAAALAATLGGCAAHRFAYTEDGLRVEVARRAPGLPADEIVVPFEIGAAEKARMRELARDADTAETRVRVVLTAMFDPEAFGLRYAPGVTGDAAETLRTHRGNCLALASVFVGLARAVGLDAFYMDASIRVHETTYADDGLAVSSGHITAMVDTGNRKVGLDFARLGKVVWYRVLDDVEALAHFYNNRGFEIIDEARAREAPVNWEAAAREFRLATRVLPSFALAWNNLGIAAANAGRDEEAVGYYEEAIRCDPKLAAPRNNLGALRLRQGDARAARAALEPAARLESIGPHVLYNLALARLGTGDRAGALEALRRASNAGYSRAQRLLDRLAVAVAEPLPEDAREP